MEKNNLRVLGLDISKSSVSACLLLDKPTQPRQYYYDCQFYKFKADAAGIKAMLDLKPDVAVMEPTGVNYARLWGTHLARAGIEVRLVGHKELKNYRAHHLALPDKDDDADALALGCYFFDYCEEPRRFVQIRDTVIVRIRELVLRLNHLNRVQSPIINRIRQDLAWQFPESALIKSIRNSEGEVPLLWGWLAQQRQAARYDNLYAQTVGLGITSSVRYHAERLCSLQKEEWEVEQELYTLISSEKFADYHTVFNDFGFGLRLKAVLLSQIYPLENYLDANGEPEIKIRRGRRSGKPTKRYLSLRRFQKALGVAPSMNSSGDKHSIKVVGGCDLCRIALWQWVFVRIEPKRFRLKNQIGKALGDYLDTEKAAGKPARLLRSRAAAKAAKLLFKDLVKQIRINENNLE
jgi:transposase